ncbi:TylF/MycF/NovP-related O-methyltransferase [Methanoregula formicica]|uniref:Macrocin-O-methyltransferase (TylF) n=1 Tax=Methanoregula formicica (strain DSM 22288 / NBRC 105244 / SMSP) TaxID=593750 RepID=L0HCH8_METFS|nr:TylF/MycF/NovP-related O-methyltransferase [Methanoregula formicica]AGB02447.1 Macrocin-O-methyltransferase (TylF) [Methanoregula formicica SMSP]
MVNWKTSARKIFNFLGYDIKKNNYPIDFEKKDIEIIESVLPFTLTNTDRIYPLIQSVKYIIENEIEGDIVECGVWKGGSMMTVALTLNNLNQFSRNLYLYDTFEGMPKPTESDVDYIGEPAIETFQKVKKSDTASDWVNCSLEEVKKNLELTGYPKEKIFYIKGLVEDTIPKVISDKIAILRLDTDFYSSTKHELNMLYPKLSKGGILIIDDYGYWAGSRKAVDEYFKENSIKTYLQRLDYSARLCIKYDC